MSRVDTRTVEHLDAALLRVAPAGGHGHGRSHAALVDERADVLAFLAHHTGLAWPALA